MRILRAAAGAQVAAAAVAAAIQMKVNRVDEW